MKTKAALAGVTVLLLSLPAAAGAASFWSGQNISPGEVIEDDFYGAGERILLHNAVREDAFAAGREIEVAGAIGGDLFAAGERVELTGSIGDDVYAAGEVVEIRGERVDDVFAAGSEVSIGSDTLVGGDAYLAGAVVRIGGTIEGSVRVAGDAIHFADDTVIAGDLTTYGEKRPTIPDSVTVSGTVRHLSPEVRQHEQDAYAALLAWVRGLISWFVAGLLLVLLLPQLASRIVEQSRETPLGSFGIGLLWFIVLLPLVFLLLVTVIGAPLVLAVIGITLFLIPLGMAAATVIAGTWAGRYVLPQLATPHLSWQHALLGALVLKLVRLVPVAGNLIVLILVIVALGASLRALWQMLTIRVEPTDAAPAPSA